MCAAVWEGRAHCIDLSKLKHERSVHASLTELATLGWWLLSTDLPHDFSVVLPRSNSAIRQFARSGFLFAAQRRNVELIQSGESVRVEDLLHNQLTLLNVDWRVYDDASSRLRVVTDLEDPSRVPPAPSKGRRYNWIDALHADTALEPKERRLNFNGDADQVLYEGISNVHNWSTSNPRARDVQRNSRWRKTRRSRSSLQFQSTSYRCDG